MGVAIHAPPQGTPEVHVIVGVQVEPVLQGLLSPTVQMVEVEGAPAIHWPRHGRPVVQVIVGVQREEGRQGASVPMVQGITGGGVQMSIHRPPQGFPVSHGIVGVHVQDVGQGALSPMVQGTVYLGGGTGVLVRGGYAAHARSGKERR